jgi:ATP-dependent helicase YprA (DUF1998 family)
MALNPVTFTERVVDDFLRYQLTTYPLADSDLYGQLRELLRLERSRETPLRKGPFVSLSRPFKAGATVADLVADGVFHPAMETVVPFPRLRAHQEEAIRAIHRGDTTLVSTGTGSGKTEAFLYPIISRCLELQQQGAPPGIVAVLVYPMNALAEDQLDRLRSLLAGRGVSFGMYVGKTPEDEARVTARRLPAGTSNESYRQQQDLLREQGRSDSLLPPEERASRAAMRAAGGQPRILLTNVKQLELLLTRGKDVGLFEGAPLEYLVFDEAHTFRGAQGAETACLIRRLRAFCGREAGQVRHVATSATMADPDGGDQAARDFARRFFGVDGERVALVREQYDEQRWADERRPASAAPADPQAVLEAVLQAVDAEHPAEALAAPLAALGCEPLPAEGWQTALAAQLASRELVFQLARALERPQALAALPSLLADSLGRAPSEAEVLAWLALGAATGRDEHEPFLRPVTHSFVRGVGGAVVTFDEPGSAARLWLSGEDAVAELGEGLHRFPVITCITCGQHYYETSVKDFGLATGTTQGPSGGDLVGEARVWPQLPVEEGGRRVVLVDRLVSVPDEDEGEGDDGAGGDGLADHGRLHALWLCRCCGSLQATPAGHCAQCTEVDALVPVHAVRQSERHEGLLHSCVSCQAPGRRPGGRSYREPARPVRAVAVSDVHVLAQSMLHLSERPRLLVFADNRQEAAFQAGWMQDHARRFRLRALLAEGIGEDGVALGDLVHGIDAQLEADVELSRALLPEVWQVVPHEDGVIRHREERLFFLRILALRELATGVKQRLGLEPWGRLKVGYRGLDSEHEFVRRWASVLGTSPEALVEGCALLLDQMRRLRALQDEHTKVFATRWNAGDKEVQYGYVPLFAGGPKGYKLERETGDDRGRVGQWIGARPSQFGKAVRSWGLDARQADDFLRELWAVLLELRILRPVTLTGWNKPLPNCAGVHQVASEALVLRPHRGRYRCQRCRRTTVRQGPTGVCAAWNCGGRLEWEAEDPDNFDLRLLDGGYQMLRVAEHSAQVPHAKRERLENQFKGASERLNTLVCTPTLELGVDIGALDAVLMRNVPPTAANYWQRAGRAGRRHRMAVDLTYAQAKNFDQAYFRDPLKLLRGQVEPPRFNLKNALMIRKHVHAAVLTALHGVARAADSERRAGIERTLKTCFPPMLTSYLFDGLGNVLETPQDVSGLGALVRTHREEVMQAVRRAFPLCWPVEDADAVDEGLLAGMVGGMHLELAQIVARFKRRLDWARGEIERLHEIRRQRGTLDPDDRAHEIRCDKVIRRFKGTLQRRRQDSQGGAEDAETMGALAREGFLPGYGLESGSIVGTAEPPRSAQGLSDFALPRPPVLALREYVPGNAIYANGYRFVPRLFQLPPEERLRFTVVPGQQVVLDAGVDAAAAALGAEEIRAVPVSDVMMPSQSQISDEEDFRFQMPSAVYGMERGVHRGGQAWEWGGLDLRFRRGVQLRLVNVGPRREVDAQRYGYPVCLTCGQSLSPFSSQTARQDFEQKHLEKCGHRVEPTGFYADVEVDALGLHEIEDRRLGFSVAEALRAGATRVLDMELEDLQLLAIGRTGQETCDLLLYDPMPGGSGLLEQLAERWPEVRAAALELLEGCPSACATSCVDCLQTYRNGWYHAHLDRHAAIEALQEDKGPLRPVREIPENQPRTPSTAGQAQTHIEARFRRMLIEADLPAPLAQHVIPLGAAFGGMTIADFFYPGEDEDDKGVAIYLDGMGGHIHGNPEQAERDRAIRARLQQLGFEVVALASFELDDRDTVVRCIARIAKYLVGREKQKQVRGNTDWYDRATVAEVPQAEDSSMDYELPILQSERCPPEDPQAIPVTEFDSALFQLRCGCLPQALHHVRIVGQPASERRFVAPVLLEMDRFGQHAGRLALWELPPREGVPGSSAEPAKFSGSENTASCNGVPVRLDLRDSEDQPEHFPLRLIGLLEVSQC